MSASVKVLTNFSHYVEHKGGKKVPVYRKQVIYLDKEQAAIEKQSRTIQREMKKNGRNARANLPSPR